MSSSSEKSPPASGTASTPGSTAGPTPRADDAATPRPGRLTAAAAICGLEALALLAAGGYLLVMGLMGKPDSPQQAETGGLTVIALGLIPLLATRGLLLRRHWSRGPAVVTQIMALPMALTLLQLSGPRIPAGIALAVVAVTGLVLLFSPATTKALGIRGPARDA